MACNSNSKKLNIAYYLKSTKFNEEQIINIYNYFCKYANDELYLNFTEFKRSLGVLGAKSHDFICRRIFNLIDINRKFEISFDNYINFFNLVNFGTHEEKLEYSFNFFDLKHKGEIDSDSFRVVMLSICQLFSLVSGIPCKINSEKEIDKIFAEIVRKYDRTTLDIKCFIHFSDFYPEMLDFFDIFNNNILKSQVLKINSDQIEELDQIHKKLLSLIHLCSVYCKTSKSITLCPKNLISHFSQENGMRRNSINLMEEDPKIDTDNYASKGEKVWKEFKVSKKVDMDSIKDQSDSSLEWDEENDQMITLENENKSKKSKVFEPKENFDDTFDLFYPFVPNPAESSKYKVLYSQLESEEINLNNCIIIKDKFKFIRFFESITDKILEIIKEIDPQRQKVFRRTGITINANKSAEVDKEEFLNIPVNIPDSKGMILFGNKNVEFVLNTMSGIKCAVNSVGDVDRLFDLSKNEEAFKEVNSFSYSQSIFDKENKCLFVDYGPKIFHNIRRMYGITSTDYLRSLSHENFLGNLILFKNRSLREICSAGKSGSFFYFTFDSKYLMKTIPEHEFLFFESILKDYYEHIYNNKDTLLQRYFGLHVMHYNGLKLYFVTMNNVFNTKLKVHYKYDLKGSRYQRISKDPSKHDYSDYDYSIPLKDLDFIDRKENIKLTKIDSDLICKQAQADSFFLSSKNVNDYSLLIGIHEIKNQNNNGSSLITEMVNLYNKEEVFLGDKNYGFEERKPFYEQIKGGLLSRDRNKIFYFGIIDIFTNYGAKKKMEHMYKTVFHGNEISCKPPNEYYERFISFVNSIFKD